MTWLEAVRAAVHRQVCVGEIFTIVELRRDQMEEIKRDAPTISGRVTPENTLSRVITEDLTKRLGELRRVGRGRYQRLK